jgi:hypothetical protein
VRNLLRHSKFIALPLAALLGVAGGCSSRSIVAQEIVLTDPEGRPRVFLGTTEAGTGLLIYDERGKVRAGLNLLANMSELSLADEEGTLRVVLAHKEERATLALVGSGGVGQASVWVDEQGGCASLRDREGKVRFAQPGGR